MGQHVSKGYIYVAMAFSLGVELLNMRLRKRSKPVELHHRFESDPLAPKAAPATE
jgi:predicted tellurium resistance membrane protein TerC